jgi:phage terminase large subunit-like protein
MKRIRFEPFDYHAGQSTIAAEKRRFNVVNCGRRFGKSIFGAEQVLFEQGGAIDGFPCGWFAPNYKTLAAAWRDIDRATANIQKSANKTDGLIELITGGSVEFWTLEDPDAGRSRKYKRVVVDEAAYARHLQAAWERAISPTLADLQGEAWFISTPSGRNYFHQLYQRGDPANAGRDNDWQSWTMPTAANPHILPSEIERMRALLPERTFAQEYLAQFLEDGGGVFRNVMRCVAEDDDPYPYRSDPGDGRSYLIGVDWGKSNDWTVLVVIDAKAKRVVELDRFNRIDYPFQLARLKALHSRFANAPILAESNSMGDALIDFLRRDGLPVMGFHTTSASKGQIIESLAVAFERNEITIPRDATLLSELLAFDQDRTASGIVRYGAPQGQHDDCVMALAIGWHGLAYAGPKPDYSKGGLRHATAEAI